MGLWCPKAQIHLDQTDHQTCHTSTSNLKAIDFHGERVQSEANKVPHQSNIYDINVGEKSNFSRSCLVKDNNFTMRTGMAPKTTSKQLILPKNLASADAFPCSQAKT